MEEIVERSEGINELMSHIPHWIIRWGMMCMLLTIMAILAISWFVRYPDVIAADVVLTTSQPPVRIVAQASGKLGYMAYRENDRVAAGAILASIQSPADSKAVLRLLRLLQTVSYEELIKGQPLELPANIRLGELQKAYSPFFRAYQELRLFRKLDPVAREIYSTRQELQQYQGLLKKQQQEKSLLQAEVRLVAKDFNRNAALFREKVISGKEFEDQERAFIQIRRSFEQLESAIAGTQIRIAGLEKALSLLEVQNAEKRSQYELTLSEAHKALSGALAGWEQQYLLKAPMAGKVTYLKFWSSNQYVRSGDEVMVIVPAQAEAVIGKVTMPIQNSGKVKVGQNVHIYLKNFPYEEFGAIRGRVSAISLVPQNNQYAIDITLPAGLLTSYQKKLEFRQEMQGRAEIITEELRLLERIFYQLKALYKWYSQPGILTSRIYWLIGAEGQGLGLFLSG